MKIDESVMLDILKEEYDSRISYYLSEIDLKDKNDNDLIANAEGLKVKDKAGFVYTISKVFKDESGKDIIRLLALDESRIDVSQQKSLNPIYEDEKDMSGKDYNEDSKKISSTSPEVRDGIIPRNKDVAFKRSFDTDSEETPVWKAISPTANQTDGDDRVYYDLTPEDAESLLTL
jgi:hypothetical protein